MVKRSKVRGQGRKLNIARCLWSSFECYSSRTKRGRIQIRSTGSRPNKAGSWLCCFEVTRRSSKDQTKPRHTYSYSQLTNGWYTIFRLVIENMLPRRSIKNDNLFRLKTVFIHSGFHWTLVRPAAIASGVTTVSLYINSSRAYYYFLEPDEGKK